MKYDLTKNALIDIMRGGQAENPVLQVIGSRKLNVNNSDKERYRLILSDGDHLINFAILTTQVSSGVENYSVIKIKKYVLNDINTKANQKVLLVLDMDVVVSGQTVGETIGNPVKLSEDILSSYPTTSANGIGSPEGQPQRKQIKLETPSSTSTLNRSISDSRMINQISGLTPYHNKWVIKARVANKSELRTWSNSRGEGKLFSVDLIDESGEIRCTAFKDLADKYYNFLQVDKVYYISKGQLKSANRQFNTLKNDYEMTVGNETIIEECLNDDGAVPQVKFDFVPIDKIGSLDIGTLIDVIGVCREASDVHVLTSRASQRELKKREVCLVDQSCTAITLTLWGSQAESFDGTNNPVVVIKGAKVGEFGGGKNLSTVINSQIKLNPDIQECHRIKGWFDLEGKDGDVKNLSERTGSGNFNTPWMNLKEVQDKGLGHSEKGDYFQTLATVLLIRSENAVYKACPTPDCNKKVVDLENGMYRCEKCNREYPNFKYRLLVSMNIGDWSANQWVSLFSSEAEKILGRTSQEVGQATESDSSAVATIFQEAHFKNFIFKCRAKMETYNDEQRLKTVVVKVDPVNYEEHNSYLVGEIQKLIPLGVI